MFFLLNLCNRYKTELLHNKHTKRNRIRLFSQYKLENLYNHMY
jgi:hypothetical protein